MKVSKIFGFVLCLHVGVIAVLIVQPGCSTTQPPTQSYEQKDTFKSPVQGASRSTSGLIPATRVEGLDPAFNAGLDDDGFGSPQRPVSDYGIDPLEPLSSGSTVSIAGSSFETYTVKGGDNLWSISKRYDVSLQELYEANGLNKNSTLRVGQQIQIPTEGSSASISTIAADTYQPSGYAGSIESYTVRSGDTLSKIAGQFGTTVGAIKATNGKSTDMIRVGEELAIPVADGAPAASSTAAMPVSSASSVSTGSRTHTVKAGEYPAMIARKYGMTTNELLAMNGITDPRKLQVGAKLKVSASGSAENIDSRTETVGGPQSAQQPVAISTAPATTLKPVAENPFSSSGPVEIRVIEADPLVEEEMEEIDTDALFEDAVEIPVIRLEGDE